MIEVVFSDSTAGALKAAKTGRRGFPVTILGGAGKAEAPGAIPCIPLEGTAAEIAPLSLLLDMGPLSGSFEDSREQVLRELFLDDKRGIEPLLRQNAQTMERLNKAKQTKEPIRIWAGSWNPGEACGVAFLCSFFAQTGVPLSLIPLPRQMISQNTLIEFRGSGEIHPEWFGVLAKREKPLCETKIRANRERWMELARENAPLRAVVNGRLMSVPAAFYDAFLLHAIPEQGECSAATLLGTVLPKLPGLSDLWLFSRLHALREMGILEESAPTNEKNPYTCLWRKTAPHG